MSYFSLADNPPYDDTESVSKLYSVGNSALTTFFDVFNGSYGQTGIL